MVRIGTRTRARSARTDWRLSPPIGHPRCVHLPEHAYPCRVPAAPRRLHPLAEYLNGLVAQKVGNELDPAAAQPFHLLVRNGPFDNENERLQFAAFGLEEPLQEIVGAPVRSALEIDQGPVDGDLGQTGKRAKRDLLDAGLGGGSQRHRIAVTTQSSVDPKDVDQRLFRFDCCFAWHASQLSGAGAGGPYRRNVLAPLS